MKKKLKRTLAMIMSLSMLATTTAFTASAEEVSSDNAETATTDSEKATTADSEEVNISADKCLGYQITSDEYKEFLKKQSGFIDWIEYSFSFFDTLEIDDGYSLDDIMSEEGWFRKSNHFKATGTWGNNVEWVYDHGKLTISGSGAIDPVNDTSGMIYACGSNHEKYPWSTFATNISEIVISDGITDIPDFCFVLAGKGVESISIGKDVEVISSDAFDFYKSWGKGENLNIYFPEQTAFEGNGLSCIFANSEKNFIIHGYTNSPVDYLIQNYKDNYPTVTFDSIGTAENDYTEYKKNIQHIGKPYKDYFDYTLDMKTKTLSVTWEDDFQKLSVVKTQDIKPTVINGELSDFDYYYDYVEKLNIENGIETVRRLKELNNLKELYIPDSVSKLPSRAMLPDDISQLTIIANKGTYAEEYAKEYGINFVDAKEYSENKILNNVDLNSTEPTTESIQQAESSSEVSEETAVEGLKLGDANLDGDVTIADAVLLNKYLVGNATLSESAQKNADCDKDGNITSSDTLTILKYVIGSIDEIK